MTRAVRRQTNGRGTRCRQPGKSGSSRVQLKTAVTCTRLWLVLTLCVVAPREASLLRHKHTATHERANAASIEPINSDAVLKKIYDSIATQKISWSVLIFERKIVPTIRFRHNNQGIQAGLCQIAPLPATGRAKLLVLKTARSTCLKSGSRNCNQPKNKQGRPPLPTLNAIVIRRSGCAYGDLNPNCPSGIPSWQQIITVSRGPC